MLCILLTPGIRAAEAFASAPVEFDIPALPLEQAIGRFAAQAGVSVGMTGRLPAAFANAVHGRHAPQAALELLLDGTAMQAQQTGARSFRLQPRAPAPLPGQTQDSARVELAEVLVTASKRATALLDLPLPVTLVEGGRLTRRDALAGSRQLLEEDASTSATNAGPGRNRQFIRGVADSPFQGPSQATVSVQFDEARLNYSAPDPDLRLLDMERVEILKGPQGPLYGTGALGGVIHLVPHRPDLRDASLQTEVQLGTTAHGSVSPGASAVANVPLVQDRLGLRAVLYAASEGGWIDDAAGRQNVNDTRLRGARLALRSRIDDWTADAQLAAQLAATSDSQYVATPRSLQRADVLEEPRDNDLYLASATLRRQRGAGELVFAGSYVLHEVDATFDASAAAPGFGASAPLRFHDDHVHRVFTSEVRLSGGSRMSWLLGLSHLASRSSSEGMIEPAPPQGETVVDLVRATSESALFGEAVVPLAGGLRLTGGLRLSRVSDEDEQRDGDGTEREASVLYAATPSAALDWRSADRSRHVFLRVARAVRPGGLDPGGTEGGRFRSDELSSIDLGARLRLDGGSTVEATIFATDWRHLQSDYLLDSGLTGTRNVGRAFNTGVEARLRWALPAGLVLDAGAVLQQARLEDEIVPVAGDDARLPIVPGVRASLLLERVQGWRSWHFDWRVSAVYSGASRLSFDPGLDRRMPAFATLGAGLGLAMRGQQLRLEVTNLLDSRADTFAFGNPFSVRDMSQHTPLQPRTVSLRWQRDW